MMNLYKAVTNFISPELAEKHAVRMDEHKDTAVRDDQQAPGSWSWYGLHWDLLESCCEKMSEVTGIDLLPTYDYSRIYNKGDILKPHTDRPSCDVSITVNLRNTGGPWEFCFTGGSVVMKAGDGVAYRGCVLEHWREANPADFTHQVFMHYVDAHGPHADNANEYMKHKHRKVVSYKGN